MSAALLLCAHVRVSAALQTLRTTLEAAQQAAAAAASRSALRQRHQQQLASLLGSDSRPVHSHSLRRALLGERLLLEQVCERTQCLYVPVC